MLWQRQMSNVPCSMSHRRKPWIYSGFSHSLFIRIHCCWVQSTENNTLKKIRRSHNSVPNFNKYLVNKYDKILLFHFHHHSFLLFPTLKLEKFTKFQKLCDFLSFFFHSFKRSTWCLSQTNLSTYNLVCIRE